MRVDLGLLRRNIAREARNDLGQKMTETETVARLGRGSQLTYPRPLAGGGASIPDGVDLVV
jgi:hypothetical protein